jgi:predicted GIY-YIG superfamily endonuclease
MAKILVNQYLENVSRDMLKKYQHVIREYVGRKNGIYALYKEDKLCYVGLASNLRSRLRIHLRDKHAGTWNRFSVYLTTSDEHLRELESLVLRIIKPKGNTIKGKFIKAENLRRTLKRHMQEIQKAELMKILGEKKKSVENFNKRIAQEFSEPPLKPYVKKRFKIRFDYKGKRYVARVRKSGQIYLRGKLYNSPSIASSSIVKRATNGWYCWKYQKSPGEWVRINEFRKKKRN